MFRQSKYAYDDVSSLNPRTVGGRDRGGLDATVGDVSAMCGGPDMSVISTSTMKSYCHRLHQRPSHCQSPAKVFAKLKANVSRPHDGGTRAYGDARDRERERGGSALFTPRKVNATWTESNETYSVGSDSAEALTVSPTRTTPRPVPPRSSSHLRSQRAESPPMEDMRTRLVGRRAYTPMETPGQVTAHVFKSPKSRPSSRSSKDLVRSPSKGQPQQFSSAEGGGRAAIESVLSLERCPSMSPAKMFAHIKEKEIRRMREHYDSPTRKFTNGAHACQPVSRALNEDGMSDVDTESQSMFSVGPSERHPSSLEATGSLSVTNATEDSPPPPHCPVASQNRSLLDPSKALALKRQAVISLERCPLTSPAKMFAHIKEREIRRMREHYDSPTRKFTNGAHACQPVSRALNEDGMSGADTESQSMFSVDPSERHPSSLEATGSLSVTNATEDSPPPPHCPVASQNRSLLDPSKALALKRQAVISLERCPLMSPAKMIAHIKEREREKMRENYDSPTRKFTNREDQVFLENRASPANVFPHMKQRKRHQQKEADDVRGNTKELRNTGHRVPSQKSSTSTAFDQEEIEYLPEREFPPNRFRSEDADDLFESSRKDEAPFPAPRPQMVLVEDPLVIHSPHLFFHKKHKSHFKPNPAPLEKSQPEQQGSGYKLEQWTIKFHQQGLFVDGIRTLDNIPWHSTTIVERISNCVLKTLSGRTYTLIGKMIMDDDSKLPKWLLKKFAYGFPLTWKMHFEKFLSQAKTEASSSSKANLTRCTSTAKPTTKKKHLTTPSVTSASCPPPTSNVSCFGMKTSRSGRVIKQPLEFWKGGRVSVDANMNVTIHDAYETTVCMTQSKKTDTVIASQLPKQHDGVFQVCSEAPQHSERTGMPVVDHKPSVLQRKVKTLSCNRKAKTHELPNDQIHSPEKDLLSNANSSLEEEPRRSKRQRLVSEAALQSVPRRREAPKRRSNSEGPESRNSGNAELPRKRNIPASKEPAVAHSSASSSDEDVPVRRTGSRKVHRKGMHQSVLNDSDDSWTVSGKDKKRSATGKAKSKGRPPPPAPASAPAQASKRGAQSTAPKRGVQQEEDEENWTEAELVRLKETVASFPKHMGSYWVNVARKVGTRSPEECQHMFQGSAKAPRKKAMASKKKEKEESTANQEPPKITARVGTLKRKQQVRQFIEAMPKEDHDDIFTSAAMQNRHFFMPPMPPSGEEPGSVLSDLQPMTPRGASYHTVNTPPCLHITPGMIGSVNRKNDDNYIYQLQKRMKRRQVNACKLSPPTKTFPPTPSSKRYMRHCENMDDDSFVVREMFPENNGAHDESGEEEDFYFSDSN